MCRVCVIIPTHYRLGLLERALEGIVAQSFDDVEIVVIVDGHDDKTEEFLREYSTRHPQLRWQVNEESVGPWRARHIALSMTTAPLLVFHDDDDYWTNPDFLSAAVAAVDDAVAVVSAPGLRKYADGSRWDGRSKTGSVMEWAVPDQGGRHPGKAMLADAPDHPYWRSSGPYLRVYSRAALARAAVLDTPELIDDMMMYHRALTEGDQVILPEVSGVGVVAGHPRFSDAPPRELLERELSEALWIADRLEFSDPTRTRWILRRFFALYSYNMSGGVATDELAWMFDWLRDSDIHPRPRIRWRLLVMRVHVLRPVDWLLRVPWNVYKRFFARGRD